MNPWTLGLIVFGAAWLLLSLAAVRSWRMDAARRVQAVRAEENAKTIAYLRSVK